MDEHVPSVVEIILRPGPEDGRFALAVDIEEVVALSVPVADGVLGRQDGPDIMAPARPDEDRIGPVHLRRVLLMVAGMEIHHVIGNGDVAVVRGTYNMILEVEGIPEPIQDTGKFIEIRRSDSCFSFSRTCFMHKRQQEHSAALLQMTPVPLCQE